MSPEGGQNWGLTYHLYREGEGRGALVGAHMPLRKEKWTGGRTDATDVGAHFLFQSGLLSLSPLIGVRPPCLQTPRERVLAVAVFGGALLVGRQGQLINTHTKSKTKTSSQRYLLDPFSSL